MRRSTIQGAELQTPPSLPFAVVCSGELVGELSDQSQSGIFLRGWMVNIIRGHEEFNGIPTGVPSD